MSDHQPNSGGRQSDQYNQQRRQQQQHPQGQRVGRQQPPGGGGSGRIDGGYVQSVVAFSAIGGIVFGLMMVVVGKVGGLPILPGATDAARSMTTRTTPGAQQAFDSGLSLTHEVLIAYMSTELAPFVAFGIAIVGGVLAAQRSENASKLGSAVVATLVGGALFVLLSTVLIGFLGPDASSFLQTVSQVSPGTGASPGVGAAAGAIDTSLASPQFGNIIINSVATGVGSALVAGVTVFSLDNLSN